MKRLLLLSAEFPPGPGGIGTHAYQLAANFSKAGVEVKVMSPQDYLSLVEIELFNKAQRFTIQRLQHHRLFLIEVVSRWLMFQQAVHSFRPDCILATGQRSVWLAAFGIKKMSIPWVAVGHGTEFGNRKGIGARLSRWAYGQSTVLICVSNYTKTIAQNLGIKTEHMQVIHNGADTEQFYKVDEVATQRVKEKWGLEGKFVLLTVGNVTHRKGQEVVIRALPEIIKQAPEVVYIMVGLPTIKDELYELAEKLGVNRHIHFQGRVNAAELTEIYQASDLFLMTSQHAFEGDFEGFGIAVIEAALCGKPAVVSGGSGLQEAVIDGSTGIVVPENDSLSVACAVIDLYENTDRLYNLGRAAQQRATLEFTWEQVSMRYGMLIERCLK